MTPKLLTSFLLAAVFSLGCPALASSSVTLTVAPNPSTFGHPVTLTAAVLPNTATGKVTFYAGAQILGLATVFGGAASLVTSQIPAGAQSLSARYDGDANNLSALSPLVGTTVGAAPGSGFPGGQSLTAGVNPSWTVTGDFNGDGKLDAAVVTGSSQAVFVYLGNGNGTFQTALSYPAGAVPTAVEAGDFNGDGKLDLVVIDAYDGEVEPGINASVNVLLGNGDGSFQAPISYSCDEAPYAVVVADFNNDGLPDVAVANESYSDVSVYLGNGDGTLQAPGLYTTNTTLLAGAVGLAIGDFNKDGFLDIAVAQTNQQGSSSGSVAVLLGGVNGTFTLSGSFPSGSSANDVETADLSGDGNLDLVVADAGTGQIAVLLGNGNGTFQPLVQYTAQTGTSSIVISDFTGDGKLDIVATNYETGSTGSLSLLPGNGDGTFQTAQNFNAGPGPVRAASGDFNGDGLVDLAIADLGAYTTNSGGLYVTLGGCTTVTPTAPLTYDANGGSATFTIQAASPACAWTATSPVSWITFSPASGTGKGTVTATILPYSPPAVDPSDRSATMTVGSANISVFEAFTVQQFADVPPASYQFDAVNLLKAKGITSGCTATDFCPSANITRDQMAIFIVRAVYGGDDFTIQPIQYFADVTPTTFGYKWIEKMFELGITNGCGNGDYCPTEQVTRDQMAVFIIRLRYGATTNFTYEPTPFFTDVPMSDFAFKWIQRMKEDNVTLGCAPTDYCPTNPVVRGDMAIFIMRGGFNQLLPSTEPILTMVSPATLAVGGSATFTVTGLNTNFDNTTTVVNVGGGGVGGPNEPAVSLTASNVVVNSPTQLTVTLTSDPSAPAQPQAVYVQTGAQEAVIPNAIAVQ